MYWRGFALATYSRCEPLLNMHIGGTFRSPCDVIDIVITMKNTLGLNLGWSSHNWDQVETVLNISKLSKWPPFWGSDKLYVGSNTGSWVYQKYSHERCQYFETFGRRSSLNIDGDKAISKLYLVCDLLTSSMTSSIRVYDNIVVLLWYLRAGSLTMISLFIF